MQVIHYVGAILIAPLVPFLFYFSKHEASFSQNQVDWGAFGSYMGGVSGPIIAAITLVFLIDSYRQQSKVSSVQVDLSLIKDHVDFVMNYKTQYSGSYEGIEYLNHLWELTSNIKGEIDDNSVTARYQQNIGQIQPLVENFKFVLKQISTDRCLDSTERMNFINLYYSKLTSVEVKLLLAVAITDDELHSLLSRYRYNLPISKPASEDALINFLIQRTET